MIFQKVPEAYQINDLIKQKNYLVNGELKSWSGKMTDVYSSLTDVMTYYVVDDSKITDSSD